MTKDTIIEQFTAEFGAPVGQPTTVRIEHPESMVLSRDEVIAFATRLYKAGNEAGRKEREGEIRKVSITRTRKLRIGQNEYARTKLKLTEKQIDDHNDYCEAWEEGYDAAKKEVEALIRTPEERTTAKDALPLFKEIKDNWDRQAEELMGDLPPNQ